MIPKDLVPLAAKSFAIIENQSEKPAAAMIAHQGRGP